MRVAIYGRHGGKLLNNTLEMIQFIATEVGAEHHHVTNNSKHGVSAYIGRQIDCPECKKVDNDGTTRSEIVNEDSEMVK